MGKPVAGADVELSANGRHYSVHTGQDGSFSIKAPVSREASVTVHAAGFSPAKYRIQAYESLKISLALAGSAQHIVVTATRSPLGPGESADAVQVLPRHALQQSAAISFGDRLRQVTGLSFFRRSSTLVANPTSQGVSLRGLGSTSASRTLVLANGIPISDPFGGWIYWDQIPSLAISNVDIVSGGVSSLYGSSAIGGVINVMEREPTSTAYALDAGYGQENTSHASMLVTGVHGPWSGMAAGDFLRTDGYIEVAPQVRGPIDTPANVHYENGELYGRRQFSNGASAYLRGNVLHEARGNGTPLQKNSTRLWRYAAGFMLPTGSTGIVSLSLFGGQEHYFQSFSAVPGNQSSETLTRLQHVSTQQAGASARWSKQLPWNVILLTGADVNDIRGTDNEAPILQNRPNGLAETSARQRDVGEYGELLFQKNAWIVTGSLRFDDFLNIDAMQHEQTGSSPISTTTIPDRSQTILSPKLGTVRRLGRFFAVSASGYRAFRAPTLDELYRRSQVGQEITLPNPELQSEVATGWETGVECTLPNRNTLVRATYFWTEVNRPVTALTLSVTPSEIVNQRENLGQIRSRGVALNLESSPVPWLTVTGGYQYANATVTQFAQQPSLVGKWIPQVAHNTATMQASATKERLGTIRLLGTLSGRQYDDDANAFLLHGFFQLDGYFQHSLGSRVDAYAAIENIFNREIEVGRTPILTLGTPRMASFGVRIHSSASGTR